MSVSGIPFDDIRALCTMLPPADPVAMEAARARLATVSTPAALGRLEELAVWMAGWQGQAFPAVTRPLVAVFAGSHGIAAQGISRHEEGDSAAMMANLAAGGGAINQICASQDLGLKMFELALELPTRDFTLDAAMEERDCAATMAFGMEALAGGTDLICLGEIGAGNTTSAAAICHALFGGTSADWVRNSDPVRAQRKAALLDAAIALHKPFLGDPLEVLRRLGGREIAACAGAILAARLQRVPVILDGYAVTAAAAVLYALDPSALDHCLAGHVAAEPGHKRALERMGKAPLLDLGVSLGEGVGAALAAGIVRAAVACHNDMAVTSGATATTSKPN